MLTSTPARFTLKGGDALASPPFLFQQRSWMMDGDVDFGEIRSICHSSDSLSRLAEWLKEQQEGMSLPYEALEYIRAMTGIALPSDSAPFFVECIEMTQRSPANVLKVLSGSEGLSRSSHWILNVMLPAMVKHHGGNVFATKSPSRYLFTGKSIKRSIDSFCLVNDVDPIEVRLLFQAHDVYARTKKQCEKVVDYAFTASGDIFVDGRYKRCIPSWHHSVVLRSLKNAANESLKHWHEPKSGLAWAYAAAWYEEHGKSVVCDNGVG